MRYKSQAGEDLNIVKRDIGVPNTLISDNAGGKAVPHTELQECIRRCCVDGSTTEPYFPWHNRDKGMI